MSKHMQRRGRGGWLTAARKQKPEALSPRDGEGMDEPPALQALDFPWIWTLFHFPNCISISVKLISHSYSWIPLKFQVLISMYILTITCLLFEVTRIRLFHMTKGSQRLQWCYDQDTGNSCQIVYLRSHWPASPKMSFLFLSSLKFPSSRTLPLGWKIMVYKKSLFKMYSITWRERRVRGVFLCISH